jgi:hypothetical protein
MTSAGLHNDGKIMSLLLHHFEVATDVNKRDHMKSFVQPELREMVSPHGKSDVDFFKVVDKGLDIIVMFKLEEGVE